MKLSEAKKIIDGTPGGYRVHFERIEGSILCSDYFPGRDEPMLETEEEAWSLARAFASKTYGKCVNLYVVGQDWSPVPGYKQRKIANR